MTRYSDKREKRRGAAGTHDPIAVTLDRRNRLGKAPAARVVLVLAVAVEHVTKRHDDSSRGALPSVPRAQMSQT